MEQYDLICIGSGPAGEKAATQAAYFKKRVAIVESQPRPGGAMVNTGTVPSKALRETALACSALRRRPLPGLEMQFDHELSIPRFMARRRLIEEQEHDRIEASFDRHGIDIKPGRGRLIDAHTVQIVRADGSTETIAGKNILVATGSSPLRPAHIPFDHPMVVDADGVLELPYLPISMVIVGGGVIGCEYASIFAEIDVQITLVHPRSDVLPFVDADCRERLVTSMRDRGVEIMLNAAVSSVRPINDESVKVEMEDGRTVDCSTLLWAAGRQSNSADLGLEEIGVNIGDRGLIKVNERYQTNIESVYAAGDVIGFPALAATSMEQGRIAACDMFDIPFKKTLTSNMPIGIYTIPAISMVGVSALDALEAGREIVTGRAAYRNNVRGRMLGDEQGIVKCVFDRKTQALIGASIVGEQATELIHLAQCAIDQELGIEYFISTCFNYPSLSELYKYAAYDALQSLAADDGKDGELGSSARAA